MEFLSEKQNRRFGIISRVAIVAIIGADIMLRSYSWRDFLAFSAGGAPCNWVTRTTVYIVTNTPPCWSLGTIPFHRRRVNNVLYFDRSSDYSIFCRLPHPKSTIIFAFLSAIALYVCIDVCGR